MEGRWPVIVGINLGATEEGRGAGVSPSPIYGPWNRFVSLGLDNKLITRREHAEALRDV